MQKELASQFEADVFSLLSSVFDTEEIHYQKRFPDCRTKVCLPFDFYIPEYNLIIEADGNQHYSASRKTWGTRVFETDAIKNEYCKANGIQLLRIRYRKFRYQLKRLTKVLSNIRLQCRETGTANCFNCWDGGDTLLPISSQADIKHKTKQTVKTTIEGDTVIYSTDDFTIRLDLCYYNNLKGGFYLKDGIVYRSNTGKLAANDVLGVDGKSTHKVVYRDKNPFNLTRANLELVEVQGLVRGKRGAYATSKSGNTAITWSSAVVKGKRYDSWVVKSASGKKKYFNVNKYGGKEQALEVAKSWFESEGSTTIPQGSTSERTEMGSTLPGSAEGEDIV